MHKGLTLVAGSENTARVLSSQLAEYLGQGIGIQTLWVDSAGGLSGVPSHGLLVLSSTLVADELTRAGFVPPDARVIVGGRIVDCDGLERVVPLPAGTKALFVNDRAETARDCVESLVALGMGSIEWLLWYPGCNAPPPEYRVAAVAGEPTLVPPGMDRVIDIGVRIFDYASISAILAALGLEGADPERYHRRYLSRIVNLAGRLSTSMEETRKLNEHLASVIDSLRHGIIVYGQDGRISVCNGELRSILNLSGSGLADAVLERTIRSRELLSFLKGQGGEDSAVFRLPEGDILVHRMDFGSSGYRMAIFRREDVATAEASRLAREYRRLGHVAKWTLADIVGESEAIRRAKKIASRLAATDLTILVHGESGTGKELFASAVHAGSRRASGPFLAVDLGAFSDDLIESELFGYREGAFTGARKGGRPGVFELADGGTLFLDEIGNISPKVQTRLLRVLQEKELMRVGGSEILKVDVRVIAATNEDLLARTSAGSFREDLYYRLKMGWLPIPPLRERREDIPALVRRFLDLEGQSSVHVEREVLEEFEARDWPGNVRELRNTLTYMLAVREGRDLTALDLPGDGYFGDATLRGGSGDHGDASSRRLQNGTGAGHGHAGPVREGLDCMDGGTPHPETLTVLGLIAELDVKGNSAGRESVASLAADRGLRLGAGSARSRITELERLGLVEIRRGRSGTRPTELGLNLLKRSGFKGVYGFNG